MAGSSSAPMEALLLRQEAEMKSLSTAYFKLEEEYYELSQLNVESLDPNKIEQFKRMYNKVEGDRAQVMRSIEKVNLRIQTTGRILSSSQSGNNRSQEHAVNRNVSHRIPALPTFRGTEAASIKDPYEFLGKVKAMLNAHEVPRSHWFAALLTTLNGYDRQWAESNLANLEWSDIHDKFLHHFESPALRDTLVRDLMTICQKPSESVQEYSDRFSSLMARTGRKDNDETLVAVYIEGLHSGLQELMHVARAATLNMWKRTNAGTIPTSITDEIASAITLDASRSCKRKAKETDSQKIEKGEKQKDSNGKKMRCSHCGSERHSTEKHRWKADDSAAAKQNLSSGTRSKSQLRREKKCFKCEEDWKYGHKCKKELKKEPQAANLRIEQPNSSDESTYEFIEPSCSEVELRDLLGYTDFSSEAQLVAEISNVDLSQEPALNTLLAAPDDSDELIYTPVEINDIEGWAMVDSGASSSFISGAFVLKHNIPVQNVSGNIPDGRGEVMAERNGIARVKVRNGKRNALISAEVMTMQPNRDMIIGLKHFPAFGYSIEGVPDANNTLADEQQPTPDPVPTPLDEEDTQGRSPENVSDAVAKALRENQEVPPSARCSHPMAMLRVRPTSTAPIWSRVNFVSKRDCSIPNFRGFRVVR